MHHIAVFAATSDLEPAARALAEQLHLPFAEQANYQLLLTADYLGLRKTAEKSLPLFIDFLSGKLAYRRQHLSIRREALARALGLKMNRNPLIVDATAGLAQDGFVLAALGFDIQLIERSPIVYALVNDGIQRALKNPDINPIVSRMHLIQGNAITLLKEMTTQPDIVYLDPMFPERKKTALAKIAMRIFHDIVGDDEDADSLLETALACATERVVVKRPRLAAELAGLKPSYSLSGSSSRFDIYIR
ncbi:MAG: class I SAM-dependent methyltransferase [Gammaproteobacteria bacterium]